MSEDDVREHIRQIKKDSRPEGYEPSARGGEEESEEELDLDEFISFISKERQENEVKEELIEAFKVFGPSDEHGSITRKQLK